MWIGSSEDISWDVAYVYLVVGHYVEGGDYIMTHGPELVETFTTINGVANYLKEWGYNHKFNVQKGQTAELRIVFDELRMEDTEFTLITHDFRSQNTMEWYGYPLDSPVIVEAIRDGLQYPRLYRKACQNEILSFDTFLSERVKVEGSPLQDEHLFEVRRVTPL